MKTAKVGHGLLVDEATFSVLVRIFSRLSRRNGERSDLFAKTLLLCSRYFYNTP
jgi:hypothetical protein